MMRPSVHRCGGPLAGSYEILEAGDRPSALEIVTRINPLVVILDLGLPPNYKIPDEGFQCLQEILLYDPNIKVIIFTGNTERENALKAINMGAFDFFTKPLIVEKMRFVVEMAFRITKMKLEGLSIYRQTQAEGVEGIIGNSPAIKSVFHTIRKVASVDLPVMIMGESGTGKELTARAIHRLSNRQKNPFVVINCGAIPENLLESELFGHEKGSFTGADRLQKGKIEYAQGGTLFLDEIAELSPPLQVKLLRFLQEYTIERIGGREIIRVDVRVIAATNRNLQKYVEAGKFREDFFFRLKVVTLCMPPLRERGDDIYLLASAFLHRYAGRSEKKLKGFHVEALRAIAKYPWPGNIREMENRIRRAVVMADSEWITPMDL